ncbi:MAG: hypothetical protein DLM59_20930 [Pseudonocardiales bacterium]|nr:MAG: hypothetical protein DLM59_20930 [Pseudonocardiales bacterium]
MSSLPPARHLLRTTDRSVADICVSVGLVSVGSFTSSFGRVYGTTPTAYRASFPPATGHAQVPACVLRVYGRPQPRPTSRAAARTAHEGSMFGEDNPCHRCVGSSVPDDTSPATGTDDDQDRQRTTVGA